MRVVTNRTTVFGNFSLLSDSLRNRGLPQETAGFVRQMFLDEAGGDAQKPLTVENCKRVINSLGKKHQDIGVSDKGKASLLDRAFTAVVDDYIRLTDDVDVFRDMPASRDFSVQDVLDRSRQLH